MVRYRASRESVLFAPDLEVVPLATHLVPRAQPTAAVISVSHLPDTLHVKACTQRVKASMGASTGIWVLLLVLALIGLETGAQTALQTSLLDGGGVNTRLGFLAGVAAYASVGVLYAFLLRSGKQMGVANALWNAGTGITVVAVGSFVFHQPLTTRNCIGILLALASVGFLA